MQDGHETRVDFDERSSYGERTMLYMPNRPYCGDRLRELKNLRK